MPSCIRNLPGEQRRDGLFLRVKEPKSDIYKSVSLAHDATNLHEYGSLNDDSEESDWDSLFDEPLQDEDYIERAKVENTTSIASRSAVPIPGLYFDPNILIPIELADSLWKECTSTYFKEGNDINQIMLFERAGREYGASILPGFLQLLLETLAILLRPELPADIYNILFPPKCMNARQAILNLYRPGEGISPHVDLLQRFGDGIIGVSLQSGCVMRFMKEGSGEAYNVYLPPRSIIVLTGEARYNWTHGIDGVKYDFIRTLDGKGVSRPERKTRLSITFRWLLPGADVVGGDI